MNRRRFLGGGVSVLATPSLCLAGSSERLLKELAPSGLEVSSTFNPRMSVESRRLLQRNCSVIVPEYELKPHVAFSTEQAVCNDARRPALPTWPQAREFFGFIKETELSQHAHTLFWPKHPWPTCFMRSRDEQGLFIRSWAKKIAGAKTCDVLNEVLWKHRNDQDNDSIYALHDSGADFSQFEVWSQILHASDTFDTLTHQAEFLAFVVSQLRAELGRIGSSHTKLLINEDQLTWPGKASVIKRKAMMSLLQYLRDQGAGVDGVGLQGHCKASLAKSTKPDIREIVDAIGTKQFIRDLGTAGYEVHFSEMDYEANGHWGADTERYDQNHADIFAALLSECLPEKNVVRVGFWGLVDTDHHLWRSDANERPALFAAPVQVKPAWFAVADVISTQSVR